MWPTIIEDFVILTKILYTSSDRKRSYCNENIDCYFREDECAIKCLESSAPNHKIYRFLKCFSFIFENLQPFSITSKFPGFLIPKESRFYFNSSKLHFIQGPHSEIKPSQQIDITKDHFKLTSESKTITYDSSESYFKICPRGRV